MKAFLEKLLKGIEFVITTTLMVMIAVMVTLGTFALIALMVRNASARMADVTDAEVLQQVMQRGFGGAQLRSVRMHATVIAATRVAVSLPTGADRPGAGRPSCARKVSAVSDLS